MCLTIVKEQYDQPLKDRRIGYKVYKKILNLYHSEFKRTSPLNLGNTVIDDNEYPIQTPCGEYKSGFHIFTTLEDAKYWAYVGRLMIVKVKYTNIVVTGTQLYGATPLQVDVARKLTLIEEC